MADRFPRWKIRGLQASGFVPNKTVAIAVEEIVAAYRSGGLRDEPVAHHVTWMKQHHLG